MIQLSTPTATPVIHGLACAFAANEPSLMPARSALSDHDQELLQAHLPSVPLRDQCLLMLGLRTGLRASELGRLTIGHVHSGVEIRPQLTVQRRELKGGQGLRRKGVRGRTIPLGPRVRELLSAYIARRFSGRLVAPAEHLFLSRKGGGLQPWQINRLVQLHLRAAGCSAAFLGTHSMRKTFAKSIYIQSGHDLVLTKNALGHAHVETTISYIASSESKVMAAILQLDE